MTVTAASIVSRVSAAVTSRRRDPDLLAAAKMLTDAVALEPGGPSRSFGAGGPVPVYPQLASVDTLDYAEQTIWSELQPDDSLAGVPIRRRLIGEAGTLEELPTAAYDALLASHVLEHVANPLGALHAWKRVVRPGGLIFLVMPHRDGTFDHRRPVTSLAHLHEDAEKNIGEDDLTHLDEALRLHDLARDPGAPSRAVFEKRCRENASTRAMHHHIFISRTVAALCAAADLKVLLLKPRLPFDIFCLCGVETDGARGLDEKALSRALRRSPFRSDRRPAEPSLT